jgi:hypothetical protein
MSQQAAGLPTRLPNTFCSIKGYQGPQGQAELRRTGQSTGIGSGHICVPRDSQWRAEGLGPQGGIWVQQVLFYPDNFGQGTRLSRVVAVDRSPGPGRAHRGTRQKSRLLQKRVISSNLNPPSEMAVTSYIYVTLDSRVQKLFLTKNGHQHAS